MADERLPRWVGWSLSVGAGLFLWYWLLRGLLTAAGAL